MKKKLLTGLGVLSVPFILHAQEGELSSFNPAFFSGTNINIASLSAGGKMEPGVYDIELYENEKIIGTHTITLKKNNEGKIVIYFDKLLIPELGFKKEVSDYYQAMPGNQIALNDNEFGIKVIFDVSNLSANIVVPQILLDFIPRGYVDPMYWEDGETAAMVNYSANYYHSENKYNSYKSTYNSFFSSLNTWLNFGAWQFRNYSTIIAGDRNKVDTLRTYLQRDIAKLYSIVRVGEVDAQQSILPSMSVIGMTLFSDMRMLPDSKRGYVPDIRGIANSNAKVTVKQNDHIVYETTVAPGPFLISDLYQATYGGDFEVSVQEADGTVRVFTVPYAYLPDLMRPNQSKYSASFGTLNDKSLKKKPFVSSLTYNRGLNNFVTGFAGTQLAQYYQSGLVGLAINTGIGAVSTSIAFATANLGYTRSQGHNIGVAYSNVINDINTSISLATYHYSSSGFSSLQDAVRAKDRYDRDEPASYYDLRSVNMKNSVQVNINQPLGNYGNVYASAAFNDYWSNSRSDSNYQIGYSNQYERLSYTISAAKTHNNEGKSETQYQVSLSFPLGNSAYAPRLSTSYLQSSSSDNFISTSLHGTALEDRSLSYGLGTNIPTAGDQPTNITTNASKSTGYGTHSVNASYNKNTTQYGLSTNGALAIHSGGVTLGQYTGDTVGIIYAEGAEGATVGGNNNVRIDSRGYAIYPFLSPYRNNDVSLDPKSAANDVEFKNSSRRTAPLSGAIVKLKFDTITGDFRVFEVKYKGQNIPLGATATRQNSTIGIVGGGGILMLRENESARIDMTWLDENKTQHVCYFNIEKNVVKNSSDINKQLVNCI